MKVGADPAPPCRGASASRIPASRSTLTSKTASEIDARAFDTIELSFPIGAGSLVPTRPRSEATAMQAMPSPRPIQPIPSLVVALTLTRAEVASRRRSAPSRRDADRAAARSQITVTSMFTIAAGARCRRRCGAGRSSRRPSRRLLVAGRASRCPRARPRRGAASITAWVRTSASEWPVRPRSCSISTPPRIRRPALGEAVTVVADPNAHVSESSLTTAPSGSSRRSRPSKTQISSTPRASRNSMRPVIAEADLLGHVGVGGEGEGGPRLDAHLGEGRRRIDLADGLAQARGRDLHRDPALGDRLDGRLVEEARGRARAAAGRRPRP